MPAYNSYYPATYQNPYQQSFFQNPYQQQPQPQQQQQMIQPAPQMQAQQAPQTPGIIWVSGDAEADAYPIAPNNAVTLWHRSAPIVYFKQADASGKPTTKVYTLVERAQTAPREPESTFDFATHDEISRLETAVQKLKNELRELKKEMSNAKEAVIDVDE